MDRMVYFMCILDSMNLPQQSVVYYNSCTSGYFSIIESGYIHNSGGVPRFGSRLLEHHALVYLVEGHGFYQTTPNRRRDIDQGMLFLVKPHAPHAYGPHKGEHWHEAYLVIAGDWIELLLKHRRLPDEATDWHAHPVAWWLKRWLALVDSEKLPSEERNYREAARFAQFLNDLAAYQTTQHQAEANPDWLARVEGLFKSTLRTKPDYEKIARSLGMSYDHFRKTFTRATGVSPARYRTMIQMNEAATWLLQPGATIQAAADHFGFCDPFHFSKRFKQIHHCSPKAFLARSYRLP